MKKLITIENLGTFLGECKKIFALKVNVSTTNEISEKLENYTKKTDLNEYAKNIDVENTIRNELRPYAKTTDINNAISNELKTYVKAKDLEVYAKKSDVSKAVHYRGSVNSYEDLPKTGVLVGDMYNVAKEDKIHGLKAGDNVCYNGNEWDNMGGTIDLSEYAKKVDIKNTIRNATTTASEEEIRRIF